MSISSDVAAPATARRTRAPAWIIWSLRSTATLHLIGVVGQAALAGLFVTGDVDMLVLHGVNGGLTFGVLLLQLVAAVLLWRPGRGPLWPAGASAALVVVEVAQVAAGELRILAVHFPLGVAICGMAAVLVSRAWRDLGKEAA
jgi:hypothetical protein